MNDSTILWSSKMVIWIFVKGEMPQGCVHHSPSPFNLSLTSEVLKSYWIGWSSKSWAHIYPLLVCELEKDLDFFFNKTLHHNNPCTILPLCQRVLRILMPHWLWWSQLSSGLRAGWGAAYLHLETLELCSGTHYRIQPGGPQPWDPELAMGRSAAWFQIASTAGDGRHLNQGIL